MSMTINKDVAMSFLKKELENSVPLTDNIKTAVKRFVGEEWTIDGVPFMTAPSDDGVVDFLLWTRFSTKWTCEDGTLRSEDGQLIPIGGIKVNGEQRLKIYDVERVEHIRDICDALLEACQIAKLDPPQIDHTTETTHQEGGGAG